ncbi:MAG: cell envelope integrity protein CreD [Flavobacteriaceae bacterium]|nr:cell envelope integrity protein CreD [Flavobacteriaceae bacterium]MDZ4147493.1 cell envelope integrity protein CreD [Flavobacteriaceae bacterium]
MEEKTVTFVNWLSNSITAKMLVVGFLLVVLLIPLVFVQNLIEERAQRQKEVVHEINEKWGNEIVLSGPILKIPYKTFKENRVYSSDGKYTTAQETVIEEAYFFPEFLEIDADANTKPLHRSIFESVVFNANIRVNGSFPAIDFSETDILPENVLLDKAILLVKTSNLKGIRNTLVINFNAAQFNMLPKYADEYLNTLESKPIPDFSGISSSPVSFSFDMNVNGSDAIKFIPIGKETSVSMKSNWPSPSFTGEFLPDDNSKKITDDGFKASWKILQINRQFEQSFFGNLPDLTKFAFGTQLIVAVDEYQKSERAAKYGFLVIGLTILVFFLIQLISKVYIHPFQYVMVGLALVMFYTLLISISEHSSFFKAYIIAALSVLGLITLYARTILKGMKFPLLICLSLSALYSYIYIIIQMENYALITGSIGLFLILATIMFVSKKIDWQKE